jgi:hypothetical protein
MTGVGTGVVCVERDYSVVWCIREQQVMSLCEDGRV